MCRYLPQAAAAVLALSVSAAPASVLSVDLGGLTLADGQTWQYDLDADGSPDLSLHDYFNALSVPKGGSYDSEIVASGISGTLVTAGAALAGGTPIDAALAYAATSKLADKSYNGASAKASYAGAWATDGSVTAGYLGFAFLAADGLHYGWLDLAVDGDGSVTLNRLAWEGTAGAAIRAGTSASPSPQAEVPLPAAAGLFSAVLAGLGIVGRRRRA
ncbi:hypothetical protein [Mangrovicoccus sp. HB161399]|uniref:hypothetical protein n=1 Tax=Mangrovicoccus sp. HB161399 TaxID=2720392 RepID=UPI0015552DE8|nr:hypothetical protein [Mangrovicoccus sp. HB161399]